MPLPPSPSIRGYNHIFPKRGTSPSRRPRPKWRVPLGRLKRWDQRGRASSSRFSSLTGAAVFPPNIPPLRSLCPRSRRESRTLAVIGQPRRAFVAMLKYLRRNPHLGFRDGRIRIPIVVDKIHHTNFPPRVLQAQPSTKGRHPKHTTSPSCPFSTQHRLQTICRCPPPLAQPSSCWCPSD